MIEWSKGVDVTHEHSRPDDYLATGRARPLARTHTCRRPHRATPEKKAARKRQQAARRRNRR